MTTQDNILTLLQANFPGSQSGKLGDVYYTIYQTDVTGAPIIITVRTNANVMELGDGAYGVNLTLSEGNYSIAWDIDSTPYITNEEINVQENIYLKIDAQTNIILANVGAYSGYGL